MNYKDKTWCPYWEFCSHGTVCDRALTPKVKEDAKAWWVMATKGKSSDAPIMMHVQIPNCFEALKKQ